MNSLFFFFFKIGFGAGFYFIIVFSELGIFIPTFVSDVSCQNLTTELTEFFGLVQFDGQFFGKNHIEPTDAHFYMKSGERKGWLQQLWVEILLLCFNGAIN